MNPRLPNLSAVPRQIDPDVGRISSPSPVNSPNAVADSGFFQMLQKSLEEVNHEQLNADASVKDLIAGRNKNIHETMLAVQKADLSLKTMMQVRNKILEAYKEIMRMQV